MPIRPVYGKGLFYDGWHAEIRSQETGYDKRDHADDQNPPQLGGHLRGLSRCRSKRSCSQSRTRMAKVIGGTA